MVKKKFNKQKRQVIIPYQGIHLDLKGFPPTPKRLLELPRIFATLKINLILVEWEDTFCWSDKRFQAPYAYTRKTITDFLTECRKFQIEPVPLLQTMGHLENFLKFDHMEKLREVKDDIACICPANAASFTLISSLIQDIAKVHSPFSSKIHLGGDEVHKIGLCPKCKIRMKKQGKSGLYLSHMLPLTILVREMGKKPIIWHDMLIEATPEQLKKLGNNEVELMLWDYSDSVLQSHHVSIRIIKRFLSAGLQLWGAGHFKNHDLDLVGENMSQWLKIGQDFNFKGIVSTGWSRETSCCIPGTNLEENWYGLLIAAIIMNKGNIPSKRSLTRLKNKIMDEYNFDPSKLRQSSLSLQQAYQEIIRLLEIYLKNIDDGTSPSRYNPAHLRWTASRLENTFSCNWFRTSREYIKTFKPMVASRSLEEFIRAKTIILEKYLKTLSFETARFR